MTIEQLKESAELIAQAAVLRQIGGIAYKDGERTEYTEEAKALKEEVFAEVSNILRKVGEDE